METEIFEDKARWKGAPPICTVKNLPSFASRDELLDFTKRYCPGARITRIGRCTACGLLHFNAKHRSPSGESSGTSRR